MARVLITLLGILLLLNAMTFLLVAFQDPGGGEATAEDGVATSAAITALTAKVDNLTRKMSEMSRLKTTITKQLNDNTRTLTRKIDQAVARLTAPPRAIPAANGEDEEEEPEEEEEAIEREGGQG